MYKSLKFALKRSQASVRALDQYGNKRLYLFNSKKRRKNMSFQFSNLVCNFKILSLFLLERVKKASFLQHYLIFR